MAGRNGTLERSAPARTPRSAPPLAEIVRQAIGVVVGKVVAVSDGTLFVQFPGNPGNSARPARSTIPVDAQLNEREVLLVFEENSLERPIVIGCLLPAAQEAAVETTKPKRKLEVLVDGASVDVTARERLTLRCGKASITLTRAGKILVRGAYLLSRSSGVNRIKGGSVQIN
jgi:hypothetical protein